MSPTIARFSRTALKVVDPSESCTNNCLLAIGEESPAISMHCPGCLRQGIHPSSFDIHRLTYGWSDINNNGQWELLLRINGDENAELYSCYDQSPMQGDNFYRIKIIEKNNAVSWSPTRYVFIGTADAFRIYPNPSSGNITITGSFNEATPMKLLDITGKCIYEKTLLSNSNYITLPQLPKGIYLLRIRND